MPPPVPRSRHALRAASVVCVVLLAAAVADASTAAPAAARPATPPRDQLAPLDAQQAWQHSTGAGVTVAVLDSGVDATHPALAGRVLTGKDYVDGSTDGRVDPVGHGTAVASLIAGADAAGLAPDARILPVRVLDEQNRYESASTVAEGVVWAVRRGAQVINLSLGGLGRSQALSDAITFAMANDVVVVACTGNADQGGRGGTGRIWYPAREPGVVAVAGLTWSDGEATHWPRSLSGPEAVVSAPAVLVGAEPGGGFRRVQGTSFSAALVSATAALIRSRWPAAPAGQVVHRLVMSAEDLGAPGRDARHGFGELSPVTALTAELPAVRVNPLDTRARQGRAELGSAPWRAELRRDLLPADGVVEIARLPRTGRSAAAPAGSPAASPDPEATDGTVSAATGRSPTGPGATALLGTAGLALALLALRRRIQLPFRC